MEQCIYQPYVFIATALVITLVSYYIWPLRDQTRYTKVQEGTAHFEVRHVIYFMAIMLGGILVISAGILLLDYDFFLWDSPCITTAYFHFGFAFGGLLFVVHSVALYVRCRHPGTPIARPPHAVICSIGILVVITGMVVLIVKMDSSNNTWVRFSFRICLVASIATMLFVLLYRLTACFKYGKNFSKSLYTDTSCPMCKR
jgi:hypothetical protein